MTTKRKTRSHDIVCKDPHLTKQDHGGTADINAIAQKYMTGRLPYPEQPQGVFADISNLDIAAARNLVAAADTAFAEMPSDIRDHFGHKVENYARWLDDKAEAIGSDGIRSVLRSEIYPTRDDPAPEPETPPESPSGAPEQPPE